MSEKNIETLIHNFLDAYMKLDVDGTLSFFAENAVWQTPEGVFKGKEEMKRYLTWDFKMMRQIKFRDAGIGLVVKGNKAVYEYIAEGVTYQGMKYETPGVCIYEIDDGKIKQHRALYYDRLSIAKQAAKGVISKRVINSVLNTMEKGLR
jgi:ketosteroid isomerase-like protein